MLWITSLMSYGWFDSLGTMVSRAVSARSMGSVQGRRGGSSRLLDGIKLSNSRTMDRHSASLRAIKWATPEVSLWVAAPPSWSLVTSSWVTSLITSGPVMNMYEVLSTIRMKSVIAGEYTAPPAHGPMIAEICGTTPL